MTPWTSELQPERTALAWGRSWLAMLCASVLVARDALVGGVPAVMVAVAAGCALWAWCALRVPLHYRRRSRDLAAGRPLQLMGPAVLAASGTVVLCLAALGAVLASLG